MIVHSIYPLMSNVLSKPVKTKKEKVKVERYCKCGYQFYNTEKWRTVCAACYMRNKMKENDERDCMFD